MSVREKQAATDEYRAAISQMREEFAAFAEQFRADVAEKRDVTRQLDGFAETRQRFEDAQLAVDEYAEQFRADVARKHDTTRFADSVATLQEEFIAHRGRAEEYLAEFSEDVVARRTRQDAWRQDIEAYIEAFYGVSIEFEEPAETAPDAAVTEDTAAGNADAAGTDPETTPGTAETTPSSATASQSSNSWMGTDGMSGTAETDGTTTTEEADGMSGTAETDGTVTTEEADAGVSQEEAESVDELSQTQEAADDQGEFEDRLSDVPYGTLKKAANALGYDGDLNKATKEELIEFFSERDIDELEAALDE